MISRRSPGPSDACRAVMKSPPTSRSREITHRRPDRSATRSSAPPSVQMPSDAFNYKALCKVEGDAAGNPAPRGPARGPSWRRWLGGHVSLICRSLRDSDGIRFGPERGSSVPSPPPAILLSVPHEPARVCWLASLKLTPRRFSVPRSPNRAARGERRCSLPAVRLLGD